MLSHVFLEGWCLEIGYLDLLNQNLFGVGHSSFQRPWSPKQVARSAIAK